MSHVQDPGPEPKPEETSRSDEPGSSAADALRGARAARTAAPGAAGHSPALRAGIEALQRTIGNRATAAAVLRRSVLHRFKEKTYAGLDPVAAVRMALAEGSQWDAHELMRRLETKAQADDILKNYKSLATSCFGDDTIATAADILVRKGGRLGLAIDWMVAEGTNWRLLGHVISAASADEKKKVRGEDWLKYWVGQLGDREMAELVKLLPLDLPTKLKWMQAEGSDWDLMKDVILSVPREERTQVVEDDKLRAFFVSECNDAQMYEAVQLLGGRLRKQLAWMAAEDCEDEWIKERVNAVGDAKERTGVYSEEIAWRRLLELSHKDRVDMAKLLGGTPDQQLSLFQNDVGIGNLTWARPPSAAWVKAVMKYRNNPLDLLWVASGNPAGWGPLIRPHLWDLLKDFHNVIYPEFRVNVFWEAFGNGSTFTAAQILHFIAVLTGKEPHRGGKAVAGDQFWTRDPDDDTAREFMEMIKPGGSSGALGISREELAIGELAFCSHEKDSNGNWKAINTSYFADPWIIIAVSSAGARDTTLLVDVAGTPQAVGRGMTFFQNHARHEIGHAVGARKIGNMKESGNEFAESYGQWKKSSQAKFEGALWTDVAKPPAGWPLVPILGRNVTLTNTDVHDWCVDILATGTQKQNAIGRVAGNVQQKLAAIRGSLWGGVELVKYLFAIGANSPQAMRDNAFRFGGFVPTDPVQIYATRWDNTFVEYAKDAHDAFVGPNISWYALSSPPEMFAEMYTARYSTGVLPAKVGKLTRDPLTFFRTLESQRDSMFGKGK
ncbi:MAG TPA: hypothetical protein VKA45_10465 [Gaiellaceae bacterium]|nr:hypothetical protein [Gaiellaceae bacterium]